MKDDGGARSFKSPGKKKSLEALQLELASSPESTKGSSPYPGPSNSLQKKKKVEGKNSGQKSEKCSSKVTSGKRSHKKQTFSPDYGKPPKLKKEKTKCKTVSYSDCFSPVSTSTTDSEDELPIAWQAIEEQRKKLKEKKMTTYLKGGRMPSLEKVGNSSKAVSKKQRHDPPSSPNSTVYNGSTKVQTLKPSKGYWMAGTSNSSSVIDGKNNKPRLSLDALSLQTQPTKRKYTKRITHSSNVGDRKTNEARRSLDALSHQSQPTKRKYTKRISNISNVEAGTNNKPRLSLESLTHQSQPTKRKYTKRISNVEAGTNNKPRLSLESLSHQSQPTKKKYTKRAKLSPPDSDKSQPSLTKWFSKVTQVEKSPTRRKRPYTVEWEGKQYKIHSPRVVLVRNKFLTKLKPRNLEIDMNLEKGCVDWNRKVDVLSSIDTDTRVTRNMVDIELNDLPQAAATNKAKRQSVLTKDGQEKKRSIGYVTKSPKKVSSHVQNQENQENLEVETRYERPKSSQTDFHKLIVLSKSPSLKVTPKKRKLAENDVESPAKHLKITKPDTEAVDNPIEKHLTPTRTNYNSFNFLVSYETPEKLKQEVQFTDSPSKNLRARKTENESTKNNKDSEEFNVDIVSSDTPKKTKSEVQCTDSPSKNLRVRKTEDESTTPKSMEGKRLHVDMVSTNTPKIIITKVRSTESSPKTLRIRKMDNESNIRLSTGMCPDIKHRGKVSFRWEVKKVKKAIDSIEDKKDNVHVSRNEQLNNVLNMENHCSPSRNLRKGLAVENEQYNSDKSCLINGFNKYTDQYLEDRNKVNSVNNLGLRFSPRKNSTFIGSTLSTKQNTFKQNKDNASVLGMVDGTIASIGDVFPTASSLSPESDNGSTAEGYPTALSLSPSYFKIRRTASKIYKFNISEK